MGLTGERREAVRCFQEAKRLGYDLSRFDQVLNSLSQGLATIEGGDSGQPSGNNIPSPSLLARASVLESIGLLEDSEQLLAQAAKNQEPGADLTRAFCLMRLGRLEEAKAALDKLPADSTAGRLEEAKKALEDALDVESSSAPSKALLAQLALKEEKWETALALAEESLAMSESGWALEARAYALQALGKVEEATEAFESFLEFGEVVRPLEGDLGERLAMARREKSHAP